MNMLGFTTKTATTHDIPSIIEVQKQTWWVTYESIIGKEQCDYMFGQQYSVESLERQMVEGHHFEILMRSSEICGFASFSRSDLKGVFKLHKIYILPRLQGTGAGRYLLETVEKIVRQKGGSELRLNVNRNNPARGFYEKMGMCVLHEVDIPIGDYWMNDYVMGKKLDQ